MSAKLTNEERARLVAELPEDARAALNELTDALLKSQERQAQEIKRAKDRKAIALRTAFAIVSKLVVDEAISIEGIDLQAELDGWLHDAAEIIAEQLEFYYG